MYRYDRITLIIAYILLVVVVAWTSWFVREEAEENRHLTCVIAAMEIADLVYSWGRFPHNAERDEDFTERTHLVIEVFDNACHGTVDDIEGEIQELLDKSYRFKPLSRETTTTTTTTTTTVTTGGG